MSTDFTVIIPARYDSSRFPGKLLTKLRGKEVLAWVYEKAMLSNASKVCIATDDVRIADFCNKLNAPVVMTSTKHSSGTERVHEAAHKMGLGGKDLVINVQGDEPLLPPTNINQLADLLIEHQDFPMASLTTPILDERELRDPNCVKAVKDANGRALYFSRSIIPGGFDTAGASKDSMANIWHRHLGIYAYRMSFLTQYVNWDECTYEKLEKLEQLRAIYNGAAILLATAKEITPPGIDTPADLIALEEYVASLDT